MALFVAKLLDSQKQVYADSFENKLARCLMHPPRSTEIERGLTQKLLTDWVAHHSEKQAFSHQESSKWANTITILKNVEWNGTDNQAELVDEMLCSNLKALKKLKAEEEERQHQEALSLTIRRENVLNKSQRFLSLGNTFLKQLESISEDLTQMESILEENRASIEKGKFLESTLECVRITDKLHKIPMVNTLDNACEMIDLIRQVGSRRESLRGRTRQLIDTRLKIITYRFVDSLITAIEVNESVEAQMKIYRHLSCFDHKDRDMALHVLLKKRLEKFNFHFVRKSSALNLIDKPEWPLRWFMDTASELNEHIPDSENKSRIAVFLAMKANEYFNRYRWSLIRSPRSGDQSELFSLYLGRYLHAASQWKESFGTDAMNAFLTDLKQRNNVDSCGWCVLDEWLWHDRSHIEKALAVINNPFHPSSHNAQLCDIVQTLIDVFTSLNARLESFSTDIQLRIVFTRSCYDVILENFIYSVKVELRGSSDRNRVNFIKQSLNQLKDFLETGNLGSADIRKELAEVV